MANFRPLNFVQRFSIVGVAAVSLLTACQKQPTQQKVSKQSTAESGKPGLVQPAGTTAASGSTLPVPSVPQTTGTSLPTIPIKGLQPATAPQAVVAKAKRVNQRDPFSSGTLPNILTIKSKTSGQARSSASQTTPQKRSGKQAQQTSSNNQKSPRSTRKAKQRSRKQVAKSTPQFRRPVIPTFPQVRTAAPMVTSQPRPVPPIAVAPSQPPQAKPKTISVQTQTTTSQTSTRSTTPQITTQPPSRQSLAEAITITGVLQTGDKMMVIAQAPNERSARYVQAGDSIGGQVRVKSIEMRGRGEPIVILEQNGVEVTKAIGPAR